jgi:hypothetical protein
MSSPELRPEPLASSHHPPTVSPCAVFNAVAGGKRKLLSLSQRHTQSDGDATDSSCAPQLETAAPIPIRKPVPDENRGEDQSSYLHITPPTMRGSIVCPICKYEFPDSSSELDRSSHVNECIDGRAQSVPPTMTNKVH